MKNKNEQCVLPGDEVNEWIQKMKLVEHGKGTVNAAGAGDQDIPELYSLIRSVDG